MYVFNFTYTKCEYNSNVTLNFAVLTQDNLFIGSHVPCVCCVDKGYGCY